MRSVTYIYQRLCKYLKNTQRFYGAFHMEEHPDEEYPVELEEEAMMKRTSVESPITLLFNLLNDKIKYIE